MDAEKKLDGPVLDESRVARDQDTGAVTLQLQFPVMDDAKVKHPFITLRRLTAGDLLANDSTQPDHVFNTAFLVRLSGLPEATIKKLDVLDYQQANLVVRSFFAKTSPPVSTQG